MPSTAAHRFGPVFFFATVAAAVYLTAWIVVSRLATLDSPETVAAAVALDMTILVPAAFYFLVIRRTRVPTVSLIPVVVISLVLASRMLPSEHHRTLGMIEVLAIPAELGLLAWIGWRTARSLRGTRADGSGDPVVQYRKTALGIVRHERAAALVASELAMLHYALGAWRATPHVPTGTRAFTHHERNGHGGIVLGLLMLLAVEGFAVHFLLMRWSGVAAWIFTLSTLYGALWVLADYRATVLRPILVGEDSVLFRAGLRTTLQVPRKVVAGIARREPESSRERLKLSFIGEPTHWITLREPMVAEGVFASRRRVRFVGLEPDRAEDFVSSLDLPPGSPLPAAGQSPGDL